MNESTSVIIKFFIILTGCLSGLGLAPYVEDGKMTNASIILEKLHSNVFISILLFIFFIVIYLILLRTKK